MQRPNGNSLRNGALVVSIAIASISFGWGFGLSKSEDLSGRVDDQERRLRAVEIETKAYRAEITARLDAIQQQLAEIRHELERLSNDDS